VLFNTESTTRQVIPDHPGIQIANRQQVCTSHSKEHVVVLTHW